jgi:hypothetical protein
MSWPSLLPPSHRSGPLTRLAGAALLLAPPALLAAVGSVAPGWHRQALHATAGALALLALGLVRCDPVRRVLLGKPLVALYLTAFAAFRLWARELAPWEAHLISGALLTVPVVLLALQELHATAASAPRRARLLLSRLAERKVWPVNLAECRGLPEVASLRAALRDDPTPALILLMHPKSEVRVAVLAALAGRSRWRRVQALVVLQVARHAPEPAVRAAAVTALNGVSDPAVVTQVSALLRDPAAEVRRATAEVLLADVRDRWLLIRATLREALADPRYARDGALPVPGVLPAQALTDLTVWSGEIGLVGKRSALTLVGYYRRAVVEDPSEQMVAHLSAQMIRGQVPAAIRVELAYLVRDAGGLTPELLERMLEETQPGPMRLIAAEALLQRGGEDPRAVEALREVARQPNREIAIAAAVVVQKWLRVDMGLPIGLAPPAPQSKPGAEVTRRVMQWAATRPAQTPLPTATPRERPPTAVLPPVGELLTETPLPQQRPPLPDDPPPLPFDVADPDPALTADGKTPWVW